MKRTSPLYDHFRAVLRSRIITPRDGTTGVSPASSAARRAISGALVVGVAILAVVAGSAVALYPSILSSSSQRSSTGGNQTSTTYTVTTAFSTTQRTSTSTQGAWTQGQVANATLGSPQVQAYIHDAYNYSVGSMTQTGSNPLFVSTIIGVIGAFAVSGNWSTGYNMTYSGNHQLNVTVQMIRPSYFVVVHMMVLNLSSFTGSVFFPAAEKSAIGSALSNSTVKSYLATTPSYVWASYLFPSGNSTYGGDYLVLFSQLNGTKILGAFVNPNTGSVVSTYSETRSYRFCYSDGYCFNDPWVVTG